MNKENKIDKLIVDKLRERVNSLPDEGYVAGAWESFKAVNAAHISKMRRARTIRIYGYSTVGVAAMLLIGLFLYTTDSQYFNLSKPSYSNSISVIENIHIATKTPALAVNRPNLDIPIKKIVSRFYMSEQREAAIERNAQAIKETEIAVNTEDTSALNKATLAVNENETSLLKDSSAFNKENGLALNSNNRVFQNDSRRKDKKAVRFGVNISPGFNSTSTNSGSTLNYSGGITLDVTIAKNLQISTGVQLEHNNVVGESPAKVLGMTPSNIDAVLTNLDIPINITWHFFSDKSRSYYVSGGVSSLAYLNEKYTTTSYDNQIKNNTVSAAGEDQLTTYRIVNVETVRTNTVSSPNALDVAGRLNLILGYEQKLSSKLNLHIEPFIKIPLTGLASENMRFTTGGVTFKISF